MRKSRTCLNAVNRKNLDSFSEKNPFGLAQDNYALQKNKRTPLEMLSSGGDTRNPPSASLRQGFEPVHRADAVNAAASLMPTKKNGRPFGHPFFLEATPGIGPGIKVLQTSALPLGYVAVSNRNGWIGADYGARTRHLDLGKVALYQMS